MLHHKMIWWQSGPVPIHPSETRFEVASDSRGIDP